MSLSDPMITNICFGGPERRTAFITCSGTGHLIAVDWPNPAGELATSLMGTPRAGLAGIRHQETTRCW